MGGGVFEAVEFLKQLNIVNGEYFINSNLKAGKKFWQKEPRKHAGY